MHSTYRITSLVLFTLVSLFLLWFGTVYATVGDLVWFHAAAVPEAVRDAVKPLYFALMKLIGGASVALGLLGLYVIHGPMRRGVPYAAAAVSFAYIVAFLVAAYTAETLRAATGAPVAWYNMGILTAVTLIALAADHLGRRGGARSG